MPTNPYMHRPVDTGGKGALPPNSSQRLLAAVL